MAESLLDAEAKVGDLLKTIPKATTNTKNKKVPAWKLSKEQKTSEFGFNRKQVHQFQQLADHKDIIEEVKAEARENEDLPTRSEVLRKIKESNKQKRLEAERCTTTNKKREKRNELVCCHTII